jgi:putative intracellular protease/amidase
MTHPDTPSGHPAADTEQPQPHSHDSRKRPSHRRLHRVLSVTCAVALTLVTLAGMLFAGALVSSHDMHQAVPSGTSRSSAYTSGAVEAASAEARHTGRPGSPFVIAFVAGNTGTIASDLLAPYDIFASSPAFQPYVVAAHAGPVPLEGGPALVPTHTFAQVDADPALQPDLVVVPALSKPTDSTEAPLRNWVATQHDHGAKVLGVCAGALVLAQTGMLDGLDATSHWSRIGALEKSRAAVHWVRGRRWVEDGSITTTAAVSSGVPAALHLVAELAGPAEAQRIADQHAELGWSPQQTTVITKDHFAISDVPVGLDFIEPWLRPTVGIALTDGVDELDATAAFEVYTQSAAGRAVAVADGTTVRTEHGLTLLTTSTRNAPSLSWLVVPGTQNIDPGMRRWAESRNLDVEPLRAVGGSEGIRGGGGFAAALENLADHTDGTTARSTAKMIGYPTSGVELDRGGHAWRTWLLAAASLAIAVLVGLTPTALMRRRRAVVARTATA